MKWLFAVVMALALAGCAGNKLALKLGKGQCAPVDDPEFKGNVCAGEVLLPAQCQPLQVVPSDDGGLVVVYVCPQEAK